MFRILRGTGNEFVLGITELEMLREKMVNCEYNLHIFKEGLDEFCVASGK